MRRLVALALMLLLPLQVWAGIVMPFCKHAATANQETLSQHHHADAHAMHRHDAGDDRVSHDSGSLNCDKCDLCHLACAGFLPVTPGRALSLDGDAAPTRSDRSLTSVIPQQPQRPPLPSAV